MNPLINNEKIVCEAVDVHLTKKNKTYFGDMFATTIVMLFVAFSLTISGWSAVLFMTGSADEGGPLGHIFKFVYTVVSTSGIV